MKNVCVMELLGRLGNNLFQVGAGMHYSKKHNVPWFIQPHYRHKQIYQYFKFPIFKDNPKRLPTYDTATDQGFPFGDIPYHHNGVKLRGFWQSHKYLDTVRDEFITALNFKKHPDLNDFTSIHIRRTDYVEHSDYFGAVSIDYVNNAIKKIDELTGNRTSKFIVFSDDIHWCKQAFADHFPGDVFIFSPGLTEQPSGGKNEYEQLSLMSSCKNNIIANSSFSYIAAYCNTNPEKIVVTPSARNWFGPKSKIDTSDLLPPEWNQIDFR